MPADRQKLELELQLRHQLQQRWKDDPIARWEPTGKQRPFVQAVLHGPTPTNWFVAANRAGKSEALAYCAAQFARFGIPERPNESTTGWIISLDANTSRDIIQPKIFNNGFVPPGITPFIPDREIAEGGWRLGDQILRLKNGSLIGFKNCESGRIKFQGVEKDWIAFDEEPLESIFEESVIRVGAGRSLRVFGAVTLLPPEGQVGGVSWLFTKVLKPWESRQLSGVGVFSASIYDNPYLDAGEIHRLESIYPEGSPQRRIRLGGEWLPGIAGARAYTAFSRSVHVQPQPDILPRRPLCWMWDFNVEPLCSLIGQRELTLYRVLKELVLDEGNIPDMVDWFRSTVPTHTGEIWLYGDATGKGRLGNTGQSDYQMILAHMRTYGVPLRMKVPETNPLIKDRVNAVNHLLRDEQGGVRLVIDPSCKELIADLEEVLWDNQGKIKKTKNRRDAYYRRSHTSDALGYWITREEPVKSFTAGRILGHVSPVLQPGYTWDHPSMEETL